MPLYNIIHIYIVIKLGKNDQICVLISLKYWTDIALWYKLFSSNTMLAFCDYKSAANDIKWKITGVQVYFCHIEWAWDKVVSSGKNDDIEFGHTK